MSVSELSRVALVTGASRGIGKAIVEALVGSGARVYAVARDSGELSGLVEARPDASGSVIPVPLDVTDEPGVIALFERIQAESGHLDVLINNAGIAPYGPIEEMPVAEFRRCIDVNLVAAYHFMHLAIRLMKSTTNRGRILNVTSVRAYWTMYGDFGGYNASKFGLRALTESVARQLHGTDTRITVGMISPGLVDTRITNPDGEPQPNWVQTQTMAELVMHILNGPDHVNYFDSIVFPIEQTPW